MQAVIVRNFNGITGTIGAVSLRIPTGLVKQYGGEQVVIAITREAGRTDQLIATLVGFEGQSPVQISKADVVEMEETA